MRGRGFAEPDEALRRALDHLQAAECPDDRHPLLTGSTRAPRRPDRSELEQAEAQTRAPP